jgi:ABC-type nitrate/sulfonate/bicarbonate transport system permease component
MDQMFDSAGVLAWTIILVLVLSLLDKALGVERRWSRWRHDFQE